MKPWIRRVLVLVSAFVLVVCTVAAYMTGHREPSSLGSADTIYLLVPDTTEATDLMVQAWLDAASEEGFHLEVMRDSDFLKPTADLRCAGIIVPDEIHRSANDALIGALYNYADRGGKLMLVYDAGIWDLQNRYVDPDSRLSRLAGVRYGLYAQYREATMVWGQVWGSPEILDQLQIPPGKYLPLNDKDKPTGWRTVSLTDRKDKPPRYALVRYLYTELDYPSFRTEGDYDGKVLLESKTGLVAGYRRNGKGGVLFVNLPLSYLKGQTDGLMMHSFLRYFANDILHLPRLMTTPDGIGGIVLNWHIDDAKAISAIDTLGKAGLFDNKFSAHFTAGPDVDRPRDGKGMDLAHNPAAQKWINYFIDHGSTIGSHGGWIHNYFGANATENNEAAFEPYLLMNKKAVEAVTGKPVMEYSAPVGNHPEWTTRWLEKNGFIAYYFAGDAGMGPTQVYRNGKRDAPDLWAFPINHVGKYASVDEMHIDGQPESLARDWLIAMTHFVVRHHTVRLIYSHPFGAALFLKPTKEWLEYTNAFEKQGSFRWRTMTEVATFLNRRKEVRWSLTNETSRNVALEARHAKSLEHFTWSFSHDRFARPRVTEGLASIRESDGLWLITAGDCKQLAVELTTQ